MKEQVLVDAVEQNYVATWSLVGEIVEGAEVSTGHPLCISSGAPAAFFNPAFFLRRTDDPAAALDVAKTFFGSRGVPFLAIFRDGLDPETEQAALDSGFVLADSAPGMAMSPVREAPESSSGIHVSTVTSSEQHQSVLTLMSESFGIPLGLLEHTFNDSLVGDPRYVEFLGLEGDTPVCASAASFMDGVAGIYNVVTTPDARGRGLGAQMTWAAVDAARDAGCDVVTLQSSELGFGVYERMGFMQVSSYNLYAENSSQPD